MHLDLGPIRATFHRTIRVPEDGPPASLPPNLGAMEFLPVRDFRGRCPDSWEDDAVFVVLHDNEALWISFQAAGTPAAVLVGAGGVNALTAEPLRLVLAEGNYIVVPPQPWLDGWKGPDGVVHQFVATRYKGGKGITVAEQLIGEKSLSGGIGLAVFEPKDPASMKHVHTPHHHPIGKYGLAGKTMTLGAVACDAAAEAEDFLADDAPIGFGAPAGGAGPQGPQGPKGPQGSQGSQESKGVYRCGTGPTHGMEFISKPAKPSAVLRATTDPRPTKSLALADEVEAAPTVPLGADAVLTRGRLTEQGIGKGGAIEQKVYPDPHGLAAWAAEPKAVKAVYIVSATDFAEITGQPAPPPPATPETHPHPGFKMADETMGDVPGSGKFTGLKTVFEGQHAVPAGDPAAGAAPAE